MSYPTRLGPPPGVWWSLKGVPIFSSIYRVGGGGGGGAVRPKGLSLLAESIGLEVTWLAVVSGPQLGMMLRQQMGPCGRDAGAHQAFHLLPRVSQPLCTPGHRLLTILANRQKRHRSLLSLSIGLLLCDPEAAPPPNTR